MIRGIYSAYEHGMIELDLQPDAARELAATLTKLAEVAQNSEV